jgi:cob(I)alamin adenosyltransferase
MKVYTRTGDDGETSLFSGGRVGKDHDRVEAYGTVDELNSVVGLLLTESLPEATARRLRECQSSLFSIGAALADPERRLSHDQLSWDCNPLEAWIDAMDDDLGELRGFILPGGTRGAALAHVARTVCRRAERRVLAVDDVPEGVVPFLNRLSDALFTLARFLNAVSGVTDSEWRSGE